MSGLIRAIPRAPRPGLIPSDTRSGASPAVTIRVPPAACPPVLPTSDTGGQAAGGTRRSSLLGGVLILLLAAGCGRSRPPEAPPADAARAALVAALDAWKGGKPPGQLDGPPRVNAVDPDWQRGLPLEGYEVLGDEAGAGLRTFTARLTLGGPTRQQESRYVVFGKEPVNVMREEDFQRNANMEDAPPAPR